MAASLALTTTSLLNALGSSPQKNIDVIVCRTAELAKCDCAAYGCIQAATGDLRFRAAHKLPARPSAVREQVRRICGAIISGKEAASAFSPTAPSDMPAAPHSTAAGFASFLGHPVTVSGRNTGALVALHGRRRRFNQDDHRLIAFLAGLVAIEECRRQHEEALSRKISLEKMLKELSTKAIAAEDAPAFIAHCLEMLAKRMGVGGSFLWEFNPQKKTLSLTCEWVAEGRSAKKPSLQSLPADSLPWAIGRFMKGDILRINDVNSVPTKPERELLEGIGIRAALIIPLFSQDAFYGCIGLECGRGPKAWVPEDVLILQTVAEIMMRCIENRQLTQELVASKTLDLQKANERLSAEVAAHRKSLADLKHREAELADRNKTFTELSALHKTKSSFAYRCLTPMEIQVANLVKQGKTNKGIAELLNLSRRTVEVHRYNIRKKLQVEKSRTNLKTYLSSME